MNTSVGNVVACAAEKPGDYPQVLRTRTHTFHADVGQDSGSSDSAPSPHDYFDAALAACKALTATWYAKRHDIHVVVRSRTNPGIDMLQGDDP